MKKSSVLVILLVGLSFACAKSKKKSQSSLLNEAVGQGRWGSDCIGEGSQSARYIVAIDQARNISRTKTVFQDNICSAPYFSENITGTYEVLAEDAGQINIKIRFHSLGLVPMTDVAVQSFNKNFKLGCDFNDWQLNQDRLCDLFEGYAFDVNLKQGPLGLEVKEAVSNFAIRIQDKDADLILQALTDL